MKKETVDIAHSGQQKVSALEEISVEWNTMQNRDENPKEKGRVRDRPALHEEIPWKEGPRQEKSSVKENPANMLRFAKRVLCTMECL